MIPSVRGISEELRRQLGGPAADAGDQAGRESGSRFSDRWKAALAAGGAAAGAVLVAATISAIEKEKMADKLSAQLGLSGKGAQQAGKLAGSLYSKAVVGSFEDGAAAVRAVMGSGLIPEKATTKSIEEITTKVSDLASTFDQDLTGTANAAAQMIRTGLAKDGTQALDLLTRGLQSGADKAGDFLDTVNEYGTQFRKAGLDGATSIGLLNQAIRAGARDSDVAADAIKEFSIRAVDGSKTSIDGFKTLGLSADDMAAKFAQGGSAATGVLDITLSRLRDIKDPVLQAQTAVALFGTQAEDLGSALLAMNPSTAAAGLSEVDGAAKAVGDTIRGNTSTQLEVLQRQFMSGIGVIVDTFVLPALLKFIEVIRFAGDAIGPVVNWLREWGVWLVPAAILVGGLTIALNAQAIATAAVTAVFSIYRGAILLGTAVTNGFAAAQAVLNAVMALNPITLVVIALVALAAAVYIAWQRSEAFRTVVLAVWNAIKTAAMWVWENALKPLFEGFMIGLRAVGEAAVWLWGALQPVFSFIGEAARILATIILTILITPVYLAIKLLGAIFGWLWDVAIKPMFDLIAAGAMWLWNNGIKPAFDLIMAGVKAVGDGAMWLWTNAIKPAWDNITAGVEWLWTNGIKPIFDNIVAGGRVVGAAAMWLWQEGIKPAWDGLGAAIQWVWTNVIKRAFDSVSRGVDVVKDAFDMGVSAIGRIWDGLKDITRKPVQFIIDTVYNNGIRKVWNMVAEFTGSKQLGVLTFASGGSVFGAGTATSDSIPALLSNGEHVWTAREVNGAGGHAAVEALRARAARGGSAFANGGAVGIPRYADGGVVDWLSGKARQIGGALMDGIEFMTSPSKAWDAATKFIRDQVGSSLSGSQWAQALSQFPIRMLQSLKEKVVSAAEGLIGGSASGSVAAAMGFARSQAGKPYQWGGAGDPSWDCSGFMSGIQKVIQGLAPGGRLWSTFSFQGDTAPAGWHRNLKSPFMIGITNNGVGHTAGTLAGMNVESRGGDGVIVGPRARGFDNALFQTRYGFAPALKKYDSGGWLQPGVTTAVNASGRPEAILTAPQWRLAESALAGSARGLGPGDQLTLVVDGQEFHAYVDDRADGRVTAGMRDLRNTVTSGRRG
ncbi:phage tail tape measure protein [Streptomyces sp. NBC_01214]|uniref:phage tail tape measure protein n=1 Tax=Streptomyces sp. NBC_01214 TaxID=2903777 RepID=UPI00225B49FB|nr:phage tail tape measure protein [Streptomyces sp. NBC_01214]MCX4801790.1 phage tail tape measure protein [Streptomyces sp. NBC_01214]